MAIISEENMFQDIFRTLRLEKKLSQDKIAEELDVSQSLINNWETNRSTPGPEMLDYIADYFNISVDYLIGRSKYRNLEFNNSELDNTLIDKIKRLTDEDKMGLLGVVDLLGNRTIEVAPNQYNKQLQQFGDENNIKIQVNSKKELTKEDFNLVQEITKNEIDKK